MLPYWVISPPALSRPVLSAPTFSSSTPSAEPSAKPADTASFKIAEATTEGIVDRIEVAESQQTSGDYPAAIATFKAAIAHIEQTAPTDIELKGRALYGLGDTYMASQLYSNAIPVFEEAIALFAPPNYTRQTNLAESNYADYLITLSIELGQAQEYLARFGTALEYYQQVLSPAAAERINPFIRATVLIHKGIVETEIGQYAQAETTLQQAAERSQQLADPESTAHAIAALAWTYEQQSDFERAIATYRIARSLYQQNKNSHEEILTLSNIGAVQLQQNALSDAQTTLSQALALVNEETDPYYKTVLFDSFGTLYQSREDYAQAWSSYRKAIDLSIQSSDKVSEIGGLLNLANLMESEAQPQLAIFFYKQAIARIETIRQDLQPLSSETQKRYIVTVEDAYRQLADLLLQQNRTAEALQILELLKIQEVKTYLQSAQTRETTAPSLLSPIEATLESTLNTRVVDLSLIEFTALPEAIALTQTHSEQASQLSENLPTALPTDAPFQGAIINALTAPLKSQPVKTAVLYPLILEDRLEIILILADSDPVHISQPVTASELNSVVRAMKNKLKTDTLLPTTEAQQLYDWLIRPLEDTLTQQAIENIIYLPDDVLRYIPIAALHDGEQWFAQKYQSHNITAASIDDLSRERSNTSSIVAGAFTDAIPAHNVQIGQQQYAYPGLTAARQEIDNLLDLLPGTTALFDQDFSPANTLSAVKSAVENNQIVHLATHAKFVPGQPEASFVLFGDGSTVNMRDIGQWELPNVDLVVFSACQTALSIEGDGKEILGLGFQIQQTGAGAAIAALWSVDDTATAALMNQFYIALNNGSTKAEALRQAQLKLIESEQFQHPYDWAAFILIGNGL